ncbi:MAG: hypothetical protein ACREDL_23155, partial [Bradyrhizobium sp.]
MHQIESFIDLFELEDVRDHRIDLQSLTDRDGADAGETNVDMALCPHDQIAPGRPRENPLSSALNVALQHKLRQTA